MKKIIILTFAASAMAFAGCSSMNETNSNKAVVVNNNMTANSMTSANVMMNVNAMTSGNANSTSANSNMGNKALTREEFDKDKDKYAAEAKSAGSKIGTGANDAWLLFKSKAALATVAGLRDSTINVDVDNGVITLNGTVGTKEQEQAAVKAANEIEGKTSVKNNLKVNANDSLTKQVTGGNTNAANMKTTNANHK